VPGPDDDDFRGQLAGLLAELAAWDDEFLDGLGGDVLLAASEVLDESGDASTTQHQVDDGRTLLEAARELATSAVRSMLAHPCDVVRGTCPACARPVALQGCGQAPDYAPSVSDVARMQRFERELVTEDSLVRAEAEDAERPVAEVAAGAARLLEQLGGFGALAELLGVRPAKGTPS